MKLFPKKNKDGKKPPKPAVPHTAQESIPMQRMFEDGTCRVRPGYYTRTIAYQDINYQLAQQEDKTAIFEEWCSFLNFFDSSIHFELSFVNTATDSEDFEKSIRIPYQQDGFDDVRAEYSQMLRQQLSKGNNGLTKAKFLTYGIEGESMAQIKPRLEHIQNDLMNNFHRLGVQAKPLDGKERLRLIAQKHNCELCRLDFQQEQGLMSSLPLADCQIEIQRGLTTSSTAIFVPFTTQELFDGGKESLYYGLNALSNNLIMVDRKKLKNPNGLILGTPGSGKSFAAKREICNAFLVTDDDIIIADPEAEYAPLVERLHGQVIHISPASTQYINPLDINSNYSEEDNPLALKADFVLSLCELIVGGKEGLQPVEKTVIDRCVHTIYRKYFEHPIPENMPLLEDLYNALLTQEEPEARHVAAALEIYVKGSLNIFNHRTNVDIHNRIVCFDIKQLGKQLKKLGMLIVQDAVWGRVTANRNAGKSTRYYIDEFHLLLKEEQTAAYSIEIWKRFRKWGGIPTGLTQNCKDLLSSPEVSNIFENSDFVYTVTVTDEDSGALTPEGNLTLVDDYHTSYSDGSGQQFITLVSKSGNTFYLVIDRNSKGENTVHFMNLVDESDLLSLMDDEDAEAYTAEKEAAAQAELERKQAEEEARKAEEAAASGTDQPKENKITKYAATFLGVLALVGLAAGGGIYVFMKQKQKKQAEKEALDPDADYTEDKGDFEIPVEDDSDEDVTEDTPDE